jgi:YVTN family beta-propeller protein
MVLRDESTTIRQGLAIVVSLAFLLVGMGETRGEAQTSAYVANTSADAVSVIDTATNQVTATIAVGNAPAEVAIAPDGSKAYVANTGSNTVSVIDTDAKTVLASVPVADAPVSLAVSPLGDRLYVMTATCVLQVIDTASNSVAATVPIGGSSPRIAITPDGKRLFIAAGTVSVIDTDTNTVIATLVPEEAPVPGVANSAVAVAISPDGAKAFVPYYSYIYDFFGFHASGGVAVIDTKTLAVTGTVNLFSLPSSIALTADGDRAYVSIGYYWADTLYGAAFLPGRWVATIDTATSAVITWTDLQNAPSGVAVTPDKGSVYVSIPALNSIATIDTASSVVTGFIAVAAGPTAVAVAANPNAPTRAFTIDAVNDTPGIPLAALHAGAVVANVLANDTIGGAHAAIGNVTLSSVSSTDASVTLDATTGAVLMTADTPVGLQSLTYQICEAAKPSNCDQADAMFTVRPPFAIAAVNDHGSSNAGATAIANVILNDTLDNAPAALSTVAVSLVSSDAGLSLNAADASVSVAEGAPAGDRALVYRICEIASPLNCADGTATVSVIARLIHAENDSATASKNGAKGVTNVLANDTLGASAATPASVSLSLVSSTDAGVTLDTATGAVSVAQGTGLGSQSLAYRICERASPANCSEATVSITVTGLVVSAVDDRGRGSSKNAGTAVANVLSNDTIGGAPATLANVTLSFISLSPANSKIRLDADGSVDTLGKSSGGTYRLVYEICEIGNPGNCGRATVTLDLSGKD